ncbi:hypothetical protein J4E83_010842 [Alternaria metachromatica]|uniref:uncharacterized protein n=1 Tax=Alternaria metachromatica TaxID=283354 RepID=UPI0020C27CF5|nr:uncharacterized protein J4E83_010842 [Alternaria metachromatica]KAI4605106.1 hypothetical protein J4E83_010842 [Alternaria metachromatica]
MNRLRWMFAHKENIWSLCEWLRSCLKYTPLTIFDSAQREHEFVKISLGTYDAKLGSIFLPRKKFESVYPSDHDFFYHQRGPETAPKLLLSGRNCPEVLGLFVQWLYTGRYTELNGPVKKLDSITRTPRLDMCNSYEKDTMEWTAKAAVLAWTLGNDLRLPEFQNYAMKRLFAAFSRPSKRPLLTPALYKYGQKVDQHWFFGSLASRSKWMDKGQLEQALGVIIIRNWGDTAVVDQEEMESWSDLLRSCDALRDKFLEGSLLSLEERREKVLVAEDYFETEV